MHPVVFLLLVLLSSAPAHCRRIRDQPGPKVVTIRRRSIAPRISSTFNPSGSFGPSNTFNPVSTTSKLPTSFPPSNTFNPVSTTFKLPTSFPPSNTFNPSTSSGPLSTSKPSGSTGSSSRPTGSASSTTGNQSPSNPIITPAPPPIVPSLTVTLSYKTPSATPYGTFAGSVTTVSASTSLYQFLGMPFANAPRYETPGVPSNLGPTILPATSFGAECPQQSGVQYPVPPANCSTVFSPLLPPPADPPPMSEQCLSINVIRPSPANTKGPLPVLFWIYGGAFEIGAASQYDGSLLVAHSIEIGEPIIFVSANYRLNGFGFLASEEVTEAGVGNLGLRDQRFAMQWIQDNIASFGGDPSKVTIWGQSAGAVSVGLHLFTNGGDTQNLFRGAFMASGSPIPLRPVTIEQQNFYDQLVKDTNCTSANNTLACLRTAESTVIQAAVNQSPRVNSLTSLNLAWTPYLDDGFLKVNPLDVGEVAPYAKIPMVLGNCDDEGTYFTLDVLSIATPAQTETYLRSNYFQDGVDETLFGDVIGNYTSVLAQGSPFDTGDAWALTGQYKRLAAVQGDLYFQAPRREFMRLASGNQNTWGYLYKRGKGLNCLGAAHACALPEWFAMATNSSLQGTDALVNFVNTQDPNQGTMNLSVSWPQYNATTRNDSSLWTFLDNVTQPFTTTPDTYRELGMKALAALFRSYITL